MSNIIPKDPNTLYADIISPATAASVTITGTAFNLPGDISLGIGSDKTLLGLQKLLFSENGTTSLNAQFGRGTDITFGQGSSDQDAIISGARNVVIQLDNDNNQTSQSVKIYNYTTQVASITDDGAFTGDRVECSNITSASKLNDITEYTTSYGVRFQKPIILFNSAPDPSYEIEGALYIDSTNHVLKYYNGSTWMTLATV